MITTEQVREKVEDYIEKTAQFNGIGSGFNQVQERMLQDPDTKAHVISIGTSIMCTRWDIGPGGGGFVEAVVDNNLMGAYGMADSINREFIGFYCNLLCNLGM